MSLEIIQKVNGLHPELLPQNIGKTNYVFLQHAIEHLRGAGHQAFLVCKTDLDGAKYTPFMFQPRDVVGLDGKTYRCIAVSHDAIWCDGLQFDILTSANHYDRPIYRRQGEPNWSFDPNDGPQITAGPTWEEIPEKYWRPHNPPLRMEPVTNQPPAPPKTHFSKEQAYAELQWLNSVYQDELLRPGGMVIPDRDGRMVADVQALGEWHWQRIIEGKSREDILAQIRNSYEWQQKHP